MTVISWRDFGAHRDTLIMIYRSLILGKLDYACPVYATASDSLLKKLDSIQYQALKIATGAVKGTKRINLLAETGEKPLSVRRKEYVLHNYATIQHLAEYSKFFTEFDQWELYDNKPWHDRKKNISVTTNDLIKELNLENYKVQEIIYLDKMPWLLKKPKIDTELSTLVSKQDDPFVTKQTSLEYIDKFFAHHTKIYTDGSKSPDSGKAGIGVNFLNKNIKNLAVRISDEVTVYTSELMAIKCALMKIIKLQPQNIAIFTDSLSAAVSLQEGFSKTRQDILQEILLALDILMNKGFDITIIWIPAHVGLIHNETADKLAKIALNHRAPQFNLKLAPREFIGLGKRKLKEQFIKEWQDTKTPFSEICPIPIRKAKQHTNNRRFDKIFTRLRLNTTMLEGHRARFFTPIYPYCYVCNKIRDAPHLFECPQYSREFGIFQRKLKAIGIGTDMIYFLNPPENLKQKVIYALVDYLLDIDQFHNV